ncbi:OmpL47-type beta-barrel domain-containing protein [Paenibacillus massiliensis]|uniref:RCC1 domain-containing protein n=1 Tax=Paenibacillus massiliensis TaxID=225917 RepID=UPI000470F197|nr:fibronectin type III domain-containing protein [Paenibacillus massiliensis]
MLRYIRILLITVLLFTQIPFANPSVAASAATDVIIDGHQGLNGYYYGPVRVKLTNAAEYSLDGGQTWRTYNDPLELNPGSAYSIHYRASEAEGMGRSVSLKIKADNSAPITTAEVLGSKSESSYYTGATKVQLTSEDEYSGVEKIEYSYDQGLNWRTYAGPFPVTKELGSLIYYRAIDVLGNQEKIRKLKVNIDSEASDSPSILTDPRGWTKNSVTVMIVDGADDSSGVQKTEYKINNGSWQTYTEPFVVSQEDRIVYARSTDFAGNTSEESSRLIQIDQRSPVAPTVEMYEDWSAEPATLIIKRYIEENEPEQLHYQYSVGNETDWKGYISPFSYWVEGESSFFVRSFDEAGNYSPVVQKYSRYDGTPPTPPTEIKHTILRHNRVDLVWSGETDNIGVTEYGIFNPDGTLVTTTKQPSVSLTGLRANTIYTYIIRAYDAAGNESEESKPYVVETPTRPDFVKGGRGETYYVVLREDGSVWTWGRNESGQLGNGTTFSNKSPKKLETIDDVIFIKTSEDFTIAGKKDGTVWAWGGAPVNSPTPVLMKEFSASDKFKIRAQQVFAIKRDGTVLAWGNKVNLDEDGNFEKPQVVSSLKGATDIALGASHSVALIDGKVYTWGSNSRYALGISQSNSHKSSPYPIDLNQRVSKFVAVGAGDDYSLALSEDTYNQVTKEGIRSTIYSWGDESAGKLGYGIGKTTIHDLFATVQNDEFNTVFNSVALRGTHQIFAFDNVGFTSGNATTFSWGAGGLSHLGRSGRSDLARSMSNLFNVIDMDSYPDSEFVLAKTNDGSLWSWGKNNYGQLGIGNTQEQFAPVRIPGMTNTDRFHANGTGVTAVLDDGSFWYWGKTSSPSSLSSNALYHPSPVRLQFTDEDLMDVEPPSPPSNLKITESFSTSVQLNWNPSQDNVEVQEYLIYYNGSLVGRTSNTKFTVQDINVNKEYSFYVVAVDTSGNVSLKSNVVTPQDEAPVVEITYPSGGKDTLTELQYPNILVEWMQNRSNPGTEYTYFQVQVLDESGEVVVDSGEKQNNTLESRARYSITNLPIGQNLQIKVKVKDQYAWSDWSPAKWIKVLKPNEISISYPSGTEAEPTISTNPLPVVKWSQAGSKPGTQFTAFEVYVMNSKGMVINNSGIVKQYTTNSHGEWKLTTPLPYNEQLKVQVRVQDTNTWSDWSAPVWLKIEEPAKASLTYPTGTETEPTISNLIKPTVTWNNTSPGKIDQFHVQITDDISNIVADSGEIQTEDYGSSTQWTVNTDLPLDTKLTVKVRIKDKNGWSDWSSIQWMEINKGPTAEITFPAGTEDLPTPVMVGAKPVIQWNQISKLPFTDYQVRILDKMNAIVVDSGEMNRATTEAEASWETTGTLIENTDYQVIVRVRDKSGWSEWTTAKWLRVVEKPKIEIIEPMGTVQQPTYLKDVQPVIQWKQSSGSPFRNFQVHIMDRSGNIVLDSSIIPYAETTTTASWKVSRALPTDAVLKASVRTQDENGWSDWSEAAWFQINSPAMVKLNYPGGTETSPTIGDNTLPTITWTQSSSSPITHYQVQLLDQTGSVKIDSGELAGGSASVAGWKLNENLAFNTLYQARVRIKNLSGWGEWSTSGWMEVRNVMSVQLLYPTGTDKNPAFTLNPQPTIEWTQKMSVAGIAFSHYQVQILNETGKLLLDSGEVAATNSEATNRWKVNQTLPVAEKLQVKVRVKDGNTWSAWSDVRWLEVGHSTRSNSLIRAGESHTVYIKGDGSVWSWGNNSNGQLGNGSITGQNIGGQVAGITDAVDAVAGKGTTLILKSDGSVWGFGDSSSGQLGGSTAYQRVPVKVIDGVVDIAMSVDGKSSIVLKSDGSLWQLGNGGAKAIQVYSSKGLNQISIGRFGAFAVKDDGSVWRSSLYNGWYNNFTQVAGIENVKSISVGYNYVIYLKNDGTVWGWGDNTYNQLTNEKTTYYSEPTQLKGLEEITEISSGDMHNIALRMDGSVWTWGWNNRGQLGIETATTQSGLVQLGNFNTAVAVSAGQYYSEVVLLDGSVWGVGSNSGGQLGNGTYQDSVIPVKMKEATPPAVHLTYPSGTKDSPATSNVNQPTIGWKQTSADGNVTFSHYHVQVLDENGKVLVDSGEKIINSNATATTNRWTVDRALPTNGKLQIKVRVKSAAVWSAWSEAKWLRVEPLTSKNSVIKAGESHTVNIKGDGSVWTWGSNSSGQLGIGSITNQSVASQVTGISGAVDASVGKATTLVLKSDGSVWGFGDSSFGQLGVISSRKIKPEKVIDGAVDIAMSTDGRISYIVKQDGKLLRLGNGDAKPIQMSIDGLAEVSTGGNEIYAVKSDGSVWRLGVGTNNNFVEVTGIEDVKSVSVGNGYAIFLKKDGTVWGWGNNSYNQLTDENTTFYSYTHPIQLKELEGITEISSGAAHIIALRMDGTVWTRGWNSNGQLGIDTTKSQSGLVQLGSFNTAVAVSAGQYYSEVVLVDGSVWGVGSNYAGQLGNGSLAETSTPVQVKFTK